MHLGAGPTSVTVRGGAVVSTEAGAKLTGLSMLGDGAVAIAGALLDGARIPEVD